MQEVKVDYWRLFMEESDRPWSSDHASEKGNSLFEFGGCIRLLIHPGL